MYDYISKINATRPYHIQVWLRGDPKGRVSNKLHVASVNEDVLVLQDYQSKSEVVFAMGDIVSVAVDYTD